MRASAEFCRGLTGFKGVLEDILQAPFATYFWHTGFCRAPPENQPRLKDLGRNMAGSSEFIVLGFLCDSGPLGISVGDVRGFEAGLRV